MIKFQVVRWKNLLSTGNTFTEIRLDRSTTTLIIGTNGAGKSTILDALCFGLFGKPFRKINKPILVNAINNTDCVVEIEFTIGTKQYKIIRGIKPTIFDIYENGVLLNRDAKSKDYQEVLEKNILHFNFKSFTQIVILGSASFVPFMQLSASDRRTLIEELLDIEIFTSMNALIKERIASIKVDVTENKYQVELSTEKIKMQNRRIEEYNRNNEQEVEKRQVELATNSEEIVKLESRAALVQQHSEILLAKIVETPNLETKSKKLLQLEAKTEAVVAKIEKDIDFYKKHDNCPTCKQVIGESFKDKQVQADLAKVKTKRSGLKELNVEYTKLQTKLNEFYEISKNVSKHNNEISKINYTISSINQHSLKLNKEIEDLGKKKDNETEEKLKLKSLEDELVMLESVKQQLSIDKHYYDYANSLMKDNGIKTRIIKQYLPIINKLVNKYLKSMDFFVNFNLDENFEETIKSRHRDIFSYSSFSEGEKLRIDLAILFTWRQIAKMKNSTNTNLLILDEVFDSSLDTSGTEEFLKLIQDMGEDTNIFVISHKGDQLFDKFRSVIKFIKKNNFSQVSV